MTTHPPEFSELISSIAPKFSKKIFEHAGQLLLGTILTNGKRTVCSVLRTIGLSGEQNWHKYHRVLSRAKWSACQCSSILLRQLLGRFVWGESSTLVFGIDETLERRWGPRIKARGTVRSSQSHLVKCSGLRWMCLMLLTPVGWAGRIWALPFPTVLCPSERYHQQKAKRHKKLTDCARQLITWLSRRCKELNRPIYLTGDGSFATYELFLHAQSLGIGMIARMKLNARLFHLPCTQGPKNKRGPKPLVGRPLPDMEKQLTDTSIQWTRLIFSEWYGHRTKEMMITSGVAIWHKSNTVMVRTCWGFSAGGKKSPTCSTKKISFLRIMPELQGGN